MFTFSIPLTGRSPRADWDRVCELLGGTLRSVLSQTDPRLRVLIAGQDRPDGLPEIDDPRVEFLRCDAPRPDDLGQEMADNGVKVVLLLRRAIAEGADAIVRLDADDRVNRHLVAWYRREPHPMGYVFPLGYVWDYGAGCLARSEDAIRRPFHAICGSSAILSLDAARRELRDDAERLFAYAIGFGKHNQYVRHAAALGRPFGTAPFRAAIYVVNHGVAWTYRTGWTPAPRKRRHDRIAAARLTVTPTLRNEFSLHGAAFLDAAGTVPLRIRLARLRQFRDLVRERPTPRD